jgi:hypothetical protein
MAREIKTAFDSDILLLSLESLIPLKEVKRAMRAESKYKQIAASLEHVGLIEPVVVYPDKNGKYLVLDGHKRLDILRSRGVTHVRCLVATDDESYNYNKRVNYLPPIGEHYMILKALADGITEERIAQALAVDVQVIRKKRNLLDGICPETAGILKDRRINANALAVLRRMKPVRQIEAAGLMVAANKYTHRFALALLAGTGPELLVKPGSPASPERGTNGNRAILERETDMLLRNFKAVQESYGKDVLLWSVACRYIQHLLNNARVSRYMAHRDPHVLDQLQSCVAEFELEKRHGGGRNRAKAAT